MINLGRNEAGETVWIDLGRLVKSRMLVQANSGGGKSWTLRRLLEQTHGHVQQIVIDPEDEFYTLREKYDYVLVRHDGGDAIPDVRSADLLARRLLELGVSAIISLYELQPRDRREFVKRFLNSLVNAPKSLWHPALVVLDEAHEFAPEKGKGGKDPSGGCGEAVIGLMAKGRKRGFCGILATQRISKLDKDAAAEANNKLIGRATIDIDRKRAAEELGFHTKEQVLSLRHLDPERGEFFVFGPAISDDVVKINVGPVKTTHPEAGAGAVPIAPAKSKIKSMLAQLADLPKEAAEERASMASLQQRVRQLTLELETAQRSTKTETKTVEKPVLKDGQLARLEKVHTQIVHQFTSDTKNWNAILGRLDEVLQPVRDAVQTISRNSPAATPQARAVLNRPAKAIAPPAPVRPIARSQPSSGTTGAEGVNGEVTRPQQRVLDEMAKLHRLGVTEPTIKQVAVFCGISHTTGSYLQNVRELERTGLVARGKGTARLTDAGNNIADGSVSGVSVAEMWVSKLDGAQGKMLKTIIEAGQTDKGALAGALGVSPTTGSFLQNIRDLRNYGVIEIDDGVIRPAEMLKW